MDSKRPDQLSHFDAEVVGDVMEQMKPLANRDLFIVVGDGDGNGVAFMGLVVSTPDVDSHPSTTVWASVLQPHGRRNVGL
jgi:hypothetical protein